GPGVGPIGVAKHLVPFLPGVPSLNSQPSTNNFSVGPVAQAPYGSASILTISWMYIRMMGADGLKRASEIAILNANYIAKKLDPHFPVLFKGKRGLVAHECIVDLRQWKNAGIEVEDVAKRLMDYGFHAPMTREHKYWPSVARIDNVYGDRNLFCSCPPIEEFET